MLTMAKIFVELFTLTLNGIAVSVWYVFSTPAVLSTGLNDHLRRQENNLDDKKRRKPRTVTLFLECIINIK